MKRTTRIAITAVTATSAITGVGVALAAIPSGLPAASAQVTKTVTATDPNAAYKAELSKAVEQLQAQLGTLRSELGSARLELSAALAAEARASRAVAARSNIPVPKQRRVVYVQSPAPAPTTHAKTGASSSGGDDTSDGGDD